MIYILNGEPLSVCTKEILLSSFSPVVKKLQYYFESFIMASICYLPLVGFVSQFSLLSWLDLLAALDRVRP